MGNPTDTSLVCLGPKAHGNHGNRPREGSHFSGCRPARGPSATAQWASLRGRLPCGIEPLLGGAN